MGGCVSAPVYGSHPSFQQAGIHCVGEKLVHGKKPGIAHILVNDAFREAVFFQAVLTGSSTPSQTTRYTQIKPIYSSWTVFVWTIGQWQRWCKCAEGSCTAIRNVNPSRIQRAHGYSTFFIKVRTWSNYGDDMRQIAQCDAKSGQYQKDNNTRIGKIRLSRDFRGMATEKKAQLNPDYSAR